MALVVKNLSAQRCGKKYFEDINLKVEDGTSCALLSKGGEGLLLLRLVRECMRRDASLVENHNVIARVNSGEGMLVIEGGGLFDFMTVEQYLLYSVGAIKQSRADKLERIDQCLRTVALLSAKKRKISTLSRIDKCMLGIAAGFFTQPDVLLIGLDGMVYSKPLAARLLIALSNIKSTGSAVLVSLTDARLLSVFDRVGVLGGGRLTSFCSAASQPSYASEACIACCTNLGEQNFDCNS